MDKVLHTLSKWIVVFLARKFALENILDKMTKNVESNERTNVRKDANIVERDIEPFKLKFITRVTESIFCLHNSWYTLLRKFFFLSFPFHYQSRGKIPEKQKKNIATGLDCIQTFLKTFKITFFFFVLRLRRYKNNSNNRKWNGVYA